MPKPNGWVGIGVTCVLTAFAGVMQENGNNKAADAYLQGRLDAQTDANYSAQEASRHGYGVGFIDGACEVVWEQNKGKLEAAFRAIKDYDALVNATFEETVTVLGKELECSFGVPEYILAEGLER